MKQANLIEFITESNAIEGIHREPFEVEVIAHEVLLLADPLAVTDLEMFVSTIAGAELRRRPGMDVRVGQHLPPPGGPGIEASLAGLLDGLMDYRTYTPFELHCRYEDLHPFMDGNGRSGRALWAWHMQRWVGAPDPFGLPFLHRWYYQSLDATKGRAHVERYT